MLSIVISIRDHEEPSLFMTQLLFSGLLGKAVFKSVFGGISSKLQYGVGAGARVPRAFQTAGPTRVLRGSRAGPMWVRRGSYAKMGALVFVDLSKKHAGCTGP